MSTDKPLIVVTNGTADEGYFAVRYLLESGQFRVRATCRRTDSERAARLQALEYEGRRCELAQAATEDEAALTKAFEGAHGIYGTTIYNIYAKRYRHENPEEMAQGVALINAARATPSLRHFLFQTMTRFDAEPESIGEESPIHFRTKWQLEQMAIDAGLPCTLLRQPAYMRQIRFGIQRRRKLVWPYPPDVRLAFIAEEDIGKYVAGAFLAGEKLVGETLHAVTEITTPTELAGRIHALTPQFSPHYRRATWLENAIFDYVVVGLKPAFRYVSQINGNLAAGNPFAMDYAERAAGEELIRPWQLTTAEDWLREYLEVG